MIQKELVHKYFEGQCSPQELRIFLAWLNDEKADHTLLQEIMTAHWEMPTDTKAAAGTTAAAELKPRLLSALRQRLYPSFIQHLSSIRQQPSEASRAQVAGAIPAEGAAAIFAELAAAIPAEGAAAIFAELAAAIPAEGTEPIRVIGQRRRFFKYGLAASIAGVLLLGAWMFNGYRLRSLAAEWKSLTNTSTRMKYCMLPDSTKVWLDPKSTLSWSMPVDEQRTVRIEGQAFFDVAKDPSRPFLVRSGPLDTKVLGTAFNIEAYPDETEIRVSLVKGKVAIQASPSDDSAGAHRANQAAQILEKCEMLTYNKDAHNIRRSPLKMTDLSDWTSGHLVFSEVPVKIALQRLSQLYRFHLLYQKGVHLENYRFSTVFTKEETPEQMIKNILFITDCTYKIAGSEVEIIRK